MESIVKIGISIPKSLFGQAEELARKMKIPRSRLYSLALEEFIMRQQNRELLAQINAACGEGLNDDEKQFLRAARTHLGQVLERDLEDQW